MMASLLLLSAARRIRFACPSLSGLQTLWGLLLSECLLGSGPNDLVVARVWLFWREPFREGGCRRRHNYVAVATL